MSSKKKKLEDYLNDSQSDVELLFDNLKRKEGRDLSTLEKSLEYWSIGKGREMLDYISERCHLGIGKSEDLEVNLKENLRFGVDQIKISYSSCGFVKEAKGDLDFILTDAERKVGDKPDSFFVTEYDPETGTCTSYRALPKLLTLIIDEGLTPSEFNDKLNSHVINILGGEYPLNINKGKEIYGVNVIKLGLSESLNYYPDDSLVELLKKKFPKG